MSDQPKCPTCLGMQVIEKETDEGEAYGEPCPDCTDKVAVGPTEAELVKWEYGSVLICTACRREVDVDEECGISTCGCPDGEKSHHPTQGGPAPASWQVVPKAEDNGPVWPAPSVSVGAESQSLAEQIAAKRAEIESDVPEVRRWDAVKGQN